MKKVYIVAAKRTAIGSMLGGLRGVAAPELGAIVVRQLLEDTNLTSADISEVIVGNVLGAGVGQGVARQVAIKAGLSEDVTAYAINMVCGSGMKAVINGVNSIKAGYNDIVIAGGTESMSNAPMLLNSKVRDGMKMGDFNVVDHMIYDALTDAYSKVHMGITAENIAARYNITREQQDEFAFNSQQKAIAAIDSGAFVDEIVPVVVKERKGERIVDTDEYPNRTTNPEKLAKLRPAFKADGTVTAGNASGINDGASFVILASEEAVEKHGLTPLCEVIGVGQGGVDPQVMGLGPVPAIRNALKSCGLKLSDMELLELNEAFAAQSLGVVHELVQEHGVDREELDKKINVNGGAIALGHPVGASGNRILVTLVHLLQKRQLTYGLASLCIGGGMGTAVVIKRV
ncbi:MAG: acetyl-CoA C-acetyltransferase [Clostridia bacterium]|nr:acetyl-CoA C-acetyltransferase [Clostridia bacterium]